MFLSNRLTTDVDFLVRIDKRTFSWRPDTEHDAIQRKDTELNDSQHKTPSIMRFSIMTFRIMELNMKLRIMILSIMTRTKKTLSMMAFSI